MSHIPSKKAREVVVQMLFALQAGPTEDQDEEFGQELIELMTEEVGLALEITIKLYERASHIWSQHVVLDEKIKRSSHQYEFERIGLVERNILRLAIFELNFEQQVAPLVIIAEANRLANKFCAPSACDFINAILDVIYQTPV